MPPKILVISGPTASGKTRLAVELALRHGGEVVSADSMQVYRRMDIGTAKPTPEEMRGIPHHMLDVADPEEDFSVARYVELAAPCVDDILARGKLPIVAGGTGLLPGLPPLRPHLRPLLPRTAVSAPGWRPGFDALEGGRPCWGSWPPADPEAAARLHPNDCKRIVRALEVYQQTGKTISQHNRETRALPPRYDALTLSLAFQRREDMWAPHRPAGGRDDGRRPGGGGPGPPGLRCPGAVHRHAGHRLQGDGRRAARRRRCLRRPRRRSSSAPGSTPSASSPGSAVPKGPNGSSGDRNLILTAACRTSTEYLEEFGLV